VKFVSGSLIDVQTVQGFAVKVRVRARGSVVTRTGKATAGGCSSIVAIAIGFFFLLIGTYRLRGIQFPPPGRFLNRLLFCCAECCFGLTGSFG
jgi:hypothetical protein